MELHCEAPTSRGSLKPQDRGSYQEQHSVSKEKNVLINEMAKVRDTRSSSHL